MPLSNFENIIIIRRSFFLFRLKLEQIRVDALERVFITAARRQVEGCFRCPVVLQCLAWGPWNLFVFSIFNFFASHHTRHSTIFIRPASRLTSSSLHQFLILLHVPDASRLSLALASGISIDSPSFRQFYKIELRPAGKER